MYKIKKMNEETTYTQLEYSRLICKYIHVIVYYEYNLMFLVIDGNPITSLHLYYTYT